MKKIFTITAVAIFSTLLVHAQSVSINTDGSAASTSAMLDVKSTSKGMLVPRMTSAQRTAISSAATGLLVFDNTTESFWFYTSSGWNELVAGDSQWKLDGAGNISNSNPGSVYVGAITGSGKLNVSSAGPIVADFNGGTNSSYIRFLASGVYRGYVGSLYGAATDMDFGAGVGGKINFTLSNNPAATLSSTGLGIGTTTPTEKLHINTGNILLSNSNLGIRLNGVDRPLITREFDPFTSGNYAGIGRWGVFMESNRLTLGMPAIAGKEIQFAKYAANSIPETLLTIDATGEINRPSTGAANLVPIAYGSIGGAGNILSGTGNFTVTTAGLGQFRVTILNENYTNRYPTLLTCSVVGSITGRAESSKLLVTFVDRLGRVGASSTDFSFIVYKP